MILKHIYYQSAPKLKTILLTAALALSSLKCAHGSRGYYDEEYPGENYHRELRELSLSKTPYAQRKPLKQIPSNVSYYGEIPRTLTSYPVRSALWLQPTKKSIASKYPAKIPSVSLESSLILSSINSKMDWEFSVENQGILGTCSSFSAVEALKFLHGRLLSQAYLIVKAEARENCLNERLTIGHAMDQIKESGVIGQQWWPYQDFVDTVKAINSGISVQEKWNVCVTIPQDTIKQEDELIKFGVNNVMNLFASSRQVCTNGECTFDKSSLIKKAMTHYQVPVVIGVPVEWNQEWSYSGKISSALQNITGMHAITLYGYDDKLKVFHFKNSWGSTWGTNGLGTISFAYIQHYAHEAWIAHEKTMRQ